MLGSARLAALPRSPPIALNDDVDLQCLYGDAAVALLYGIVQGAVDSSLAPLAVASPELFEIAEPLPLPSLQGAALALTWVALTFQFRLYRPELTRGSPAEAGLACISSWGSSVVAICGALWFFGLGPGLSSSEVEFYTGSLSVMSAWRWVIWRVGSVY